MPRLDLFFERGDSISQVSDFTFTDDATPLGIDDTSGATSSVSVTFDRQDRRPARLKQLKDQMVGFAYATDVQRPLGKVSTVSGGDATTSIAIDSIAVRLAVTRSAKPFIGTLADGIRYWVGLVKIDASSVVVDASIASKQVALVGFRDNVWLRIKQLCAAVGIEVVTRDEQVVVRPPRAVIVLSKRTSARSWSVDDDSLARTIQVAYYDPQTVVAGDITPDYTRSNVDSADSDDAGAGQATANRTGNRLPPGYTKRSVRIIS